MQVSHVQDHITHAVIGGKETIDFSISSSAEFFNILSSTLYKDQILAVVREVLCNAWDAHIEAGCTDRPVQITLTADKFTIKDFGKGIHHDDMGLIYGTYGNSTKKNDGTQTGGFGLGCKSPFAYTDHFEVTSSHAGTKTIYNLSKSSSQAMGKPGIIPITSFPSDETGLSVSIPINPKDRNRYQELITRIINNGDMNMTLNTELVATLGFDTSKGNYLICRNKVLDVTTRIMVRYGNVIYPIDDINELELNYTRITNHLNKLRSNGYIPYSIIFQAPPHSISVTPSREALSMQEHTIKTLNTLFAGFLTSIKNEFPLLCEQYAEESVQKAVVEKRINLLLTRDYVLPVNTNTVEITTIADLKAMAEAYMQLHYPEELAFRKADVTNRLNLMVQHKLLDRGLVQTFLVSLKKEKNDIPTNADWNQDKDKSGWLQRHIIAPLLTKLSNAGLNSKRLYVCDSTDLHAPKKYSDESPAMVLATQACPTRILNTLPYLRNVIVLTTKRLGLLNTTYDHDNFKGMGNYQGFLVYTVGRKAGETEEARKFFATTGMKVIDLTIKIEDPDILPLPTLPRKPTKKGLVCLSSVSTQYGFDLKQRHNDNVTRITDPEFVMLIPNSARLPTHRFEEWDKELSTQIVRLFGSKGGIVPTKSARDKWIAKGAKYFENYLAEKASSYIYLNPRIQEYYTNSPQQINNRLEYMDSVISFIHTTPELMKEFGLVNNLTDEDKLYLALWEHIKPKVAGHLTKTTQDWLNSIPLSPSCIQLVTKLHRNPFLKMINLSGMIRMNTRSYTPPQVTKVLSILVSAING